MQCPMCHGSGQVQEDDLTFGNRVKVYREAKRWTQQQLANAISRSRAQIANLESGRGDVPLKQIIKIADALGVSAKDLVP